MTPVEAGADRHDIMPEQLLRWKIMAGLALILIAVVVYLYQTKISGPVGELESDVQSQVVTVTPAEGVLSCEGNCPDDAY